MKERHLPTSGTARAALLLSLPLLGISCLVGPSYHPPKTDVPSAWTGAAPAEQPPAAKSQPTAAAAVDLAKWWRQFGDPKLTSLIEEALQTNYDIQAAEARLRQARALRGVAAGALWPRVTASAAYERISGGTAGGSGAVFSQERDLFQAGFDAAWEIDVFGGLRRSLESAAANVLAAQENIHDVQVSLISEIALVYTQLRGAQQRLVIARNNLAAQQRTARITRERKSVGFVSALDVANAEAQVATTQSQVPALELAARQSVHALSVLLARPPTDLLQELSEVQPLPMVPGQVEAGSPPDLLRRRPDIRQAEAGLRAATAQIGAAEAELFPKVAVSGTLNWQSGLVRDWFSSINHSWSVGPSASWTAFAGGSLLANVHVQQAGRDQALTAYRQTILIALQDVEDALVALAKDQERRQAISDAAAANRRAVDLSNQLYIQGQTEFINVLDAERSLFASEDALVQADINLVTDVIALYKSLGGGWELSPTEPSR